MLYETFSASDVTSYAMS